MRRIRKQWEFQQSFEWRRCWTTPLGLDWFVKRLLEQSAAPASLQQGWIAVSGIDAATRRFPPRSASWPGPAEQRLRSPSLVVRFFWQPPPLRAGAECKFARPPG